MLTVARQKKQTRREMERDLKVRERAKLATLRDHIKHAKKWRAQRMPQIRQLCRSGKVGARELAKVARARIRAEAKLAIKLETQRLRDEARRTCEVRKDQARQKGGDSVARAHAVFAEERAYQQQIARFSKPVKLGPGARRVSRHAEHVRESDDEVRANIPPELVPVFDKLRTKFSDEPRRTRTEAFAEWAHDHPGDVRTIIDEEIESSITKLIAAEEEQRAMLHIPASTLSDAELESRYRKARELEPVDEPYLSPVRLEPGAPAGSVSKSIRLYSQQGICSSCGLRDELCRCTASNGTPMQQRCECGSVYAAHELRDKASMTTKQWAEQIPSCPGRAGARFRRARARAPEPKLEPAPSIENDRRAAAFQKALGTLREDFRGVRTRIVDTSSWPGSDGSELRLSLHSRFDMKVSAPEAKTYLHDAERSIVARLKLSMPREQWKRTRVKPTFTARYHDGWSMEIYAAPHKERARSERALEPVPF